MQRHHVLLQPFLNFLQFEKRYSAHTVLAYQTDLVAFLTFLDKQFDSPPLTAITHSLVRSWLASLKDEGLSAKTINRKLSALKSFFKYSVKTGTIRQSPMTKVVAPKAEKRLPSFVADGDLHTLFQHVEFPDTWQGRTDRLILALFYQTGMRLSELIQLKESNVNIGTGTVKVLGKGSKERIIPIQPALASALQAYISSKPHSMAPVEAAAGHLLVTESGKTLQPRAVYATVRQYLSLVTTVSKRSPHVLRHSFATHLMNNGADLNAVKELLGHSSLAATQVYTHNTIEKLKSVHQKAHPKA